MDLLVAYSGDPAGSNMASHIAPSMREAGGGLYRGSRYDLAVIDRPAISADWLEGSLEYDAYVFLSKHAAESGKLALTCHSTGNFGPDAPFGGRPCQVAVPYARFQKRYMQLLHSRSESFAGFDITIEATHHGPTALGAPCIFAEVGTTPEQWNDESLCGRAAQAVVDAYEDPGPEPPLAVCFGGTHYPKKFTKMLIEGKYGLGTVVPKRALEFVDEAIFGHIMERNAGASAVIVDGKGLGAHKQKIMTMAKGTGLEVIAL